MCGVEGSFGQFVKDRLPGGNGDKKSWVAPGASADVRLAKRDAERAGLKKENKPGADPAAERAAAEAEAATKANTRIAFQRRAMRENSLLTGGGQAAAGAGRSTLGV